MMLARGFLLVIGVIFTLYGLYCLFNPMILNEYTGMGLGDGTALIEVRAMYGGLQCTMGLYLLFCCSQIARVPQGLLVSIFIFAGLAGARAYGLTVDSGDNGYNFAAIIFESVSGVLALLLLQLGQKQTA
ncbi:DUF4345 family protein [Oceanicoccus sp. KOV_DT_Chl]|uniref:DUF4345 family protein n=1 Tax=Oceanicoccus sp. KOV_DT_Chl TaxID=1904639 RepID=UPI000C7C6657|nr:DUF4345 family protein [Oceanicoccus sp. KOV_DT_Chl]